MCIVVNLHIREWAKPGFLVMFWYMITAPWALPLQLPLPEVETLDTKTYVIVWLKWNNKCKELILITFPAPVIKFPGKSKKARKSLFYSQLEEMEKSCSPHCVCSQEQRQWLLGVSRPSSFYTTQSSDFREGLSHNSLANQNYPTEAEPKACLLSGSRFGKVKG